VEGESAMVISRPNGINRGPHSSRGVVTRSRAEIAPWPNRTHG